MKIFEVGIIGEMNIIISRVDKYLLIEEFFIWYSVY